MNLSNSVGCLRGVEWNTYILLCWLRVLKLYTAINLINASIERATHKPIHGWLSCLGATLHPSGHTLPNEKDENEVRLWRSKKKSLYV